VARHREQDVAAKGERVARREAEEDELDGEDGGRQQGVAVEDAGQVVLFAAREGDRQAELEVDGQTGERKEAGWVDSGQQLALDEGKGGGRDGLPTAHRSRDIPTDPVEAKMLEGVEKTCGGHVSVVWWVYR